MPDTFSMTDEELQLYRRKRRRIIALVIVIALLIVGGFFGMRPARNFVKGWQARRHAQKAFAAIEQEKWGEARDEAIAAYQLRVTEPQAIRAVARFLSRTRQGEALEYWSQLEMLGKLTSDDLREEAEIALAAGDLARAEAAVRVLLKSSPTSADWLLNAQLTIQKGSGDEALTALDHVLADPKATEEQQLQAAILERSVASAAGGASNRVDDAWSRLEKLARGQSQTALSVLVVLAQQILTQRQGSPRPFALTSDEIGRALESHPMAKAAHKLLALDLELRDHPEHKDAAVQRAIDAWKDGDAASLVALATWLNSKGEYQKTLDTIPLEKALQNSNVFLKRMDALGALGRWDEIRHLLEAERFPLEQSIQQMYLARCYEQLGQKTASENNWQRAMEAAGGDATKLVSLAEYAEKNGKVEIADRAYALAIGQVPKLRQAWNGRLRIVQATHDTVQIHKILAGMLQIWPNDVAIQNDEAYTRLLLFTSNKRNDEFRIPNSETNSQSLTPNSQPSSPPSDPAPSIQNSESATKELEQISTLAEKLVSQNLHSLPHRTLLALVRLRRSQFPEALQVYANIQIAANALTSSALAVHAAVLFANGKVDDARTEAQQIKRTQVLPEEWALIEGLTQAEPLQNSENPKS